MRHRSALVALVAFATASSLGAQTAKRKSEAKPAAAADAAKIASALSAGPAEITSKATLAEFGPDGKFRTMRAGTNGWVCMPDDPATPGPDPTCADKEWQEWFDAWSQKRPPKLKGVGISYMLMGAADASNSDPFATKPAPGQQWVMTGSHTMIIVPDAKQFDGFPTDPMNGGPYVMWKGTPYAHLMVPNAGMKH